MTNLILTMLLYSADCALIGYDVYTTKVGIESGEMVEANPFVKPFVDTKQWTQLYLTQISMNALAAYILYQFNPDYANAWLAGLGVVEVAVINNNTTLLLKYGIKF